MTSAQWRVEDTETSVVTTTPTKAALDMRGYWQLESGMRQPTHIAATMGIHLIDARGEPDKGAAQQAETQVNNSHETGVVFLILKTEKKTDVSRSASNSSQMVYRKGCLFAAALRRHDHMDAAQERRGRWSYRRGGSP